MGIKYFVLFGRSYITEVQMLENIGLSQSLYLHALSPGRETSSVPQNLLTEAHDMLFLQRI